MKPKPESKESADLRIAQGEVLALKNQIASTERAYNEMQEKWRLARADADLARAEAAHQRELVAAYRQGLGVCEAMAGRR